MQVGDLVKFDRINGHTSHINNKTALYLGEDFIHRDDGEKEIQRLADKLMPKGNSRDYHNAMMDLGSSEKYKNTIHCINIEQ